MTPRLIEVFVVKETKCPSCGDPKAYVGLSNVECPNAKCKHSLNLVKMFAKKFGFQFDANVHDFDMEGADVASSGNIVYGWFLSGKDGTYSISPPDDGKTPDHLLDTHEISAEELKEIIKTGKWKGLNVFDWDKR